VSEKISPPPIDLESEPNLPTVWWIRLLQSGVALLAITGLLYLSGAHQYFLFQRTPAAVEQPEIMSLLDAETIALKVDIVFIKGDASYATQRSPQSVQRLVDSASNIWQQANIKLQIHQQRDLVVSPEEWRQFVQHPEEFLAVHSFDPAVITLLLANGLGGLNGISFGGQSVVAVADYTTVFDFRTLAHEIGHALGLDHVSTYKSRLMYRGANGTHLSPEEIMRARSRATNYQAKNQLD
jgi:hypothetical protein